MTHGLARISDRLVGMTQRLMIAALFCAWPLAGAAATHQTNVPTSVAEQYLFAAANAERTHRGLRPLRWDPNLYRAAQAHADQMAERESISHQYPGEPALSARGRAAGARFSVIAENVAVAPSAVRIHDAWMRSAGHRANLLDSRVDSVGIAVISRQGELYAVQDFDRAFSGLSLEEQEAKVGDLLEASSPVVVLPTSDAARRTCAMESGYAGGRTPGFVMRYTSADLSKLPEALRDKLASGKYHEAAVGACTASGTRDFSAYSVAVMLFP